MPAADVAGPAAILDRLGVVEQVWRVAAGKGHATALPVRDIAHNHQHLRVGCWLAGGAACHGALATPNPPAAAVHERCDARSATRWLAGAGGVVAPAVLRVPPSGEHARHTGRWQQ